MNKLFYRLYWSPLTGFSNIWMSLSLGTFLSQYLEREFFIINNVRIRNFLKSYYTTYEFLKDRISPRITDMFDVKFSRFLNQEHEFEMKSISIENGLKTFFYQQDFEDNIDVRNSFSNNRTGINIDILKIDTTDILFNDLSYLSYPSCFFLLNEKTKVDFFYSLYPKPKSFYIDFAKKYSNLIGKFNAVHIRRGDFLVQQRHSEKKSEDILESLIKVFDKEKTLLICTDSSYDKKYFSKITDYYVNCIFIDEDIMFNEILRNEFNNLPINDFTALGFVSQLICLYADEFVGTFTSTYTAMIQSYRAAYFGKRSFKYLYPIENMKLNDSLEIEYDKDGIFSWNRMNLMEHSSNLWMREWDEVFTKK